jgi:hypothetical protein
MRTVLWTFAKSVNCKTCSLGLWFQHCVAENCADCGTAAGSCSCALALACRRHADINHSCNRLFLLAAEMQPGFAQALRVALDTGAGLTPGTLLPPGMPELASPTPSWCDRAKVVIEHEAFRNNYLVQHCRPPSPGSAKFVISDHSVRKRNKQLPPVADLLQYLPVPIRSLQLGRTHKQRILRGTLIVQPIAMRAVATVLEDVNGDAIPVCTAYVRLQSMYH